MIEAVAGPIASIFDCRECDCGEIGEIIVSGTVVTRAYENNESENLIAKIPAQDTFFHRLGDAGYFDEQDRLWFCGRKAHRVETQDGLLLPVPCEAIFNAHPQVHRTALVGIGPLGQQTPVMVVELHSGQIPSGKEKQQIIDELLALGQEYEHTQGITEFLFHDSFPVDVRHNVKIQREKLAAWAEKKLK